MDSRREIVTINRHAWNRSYWHAAVVSVLLDERPYCAVEPRWFGFVKLKSSCINLEFGF